MAKPIEDFGEKIGGARKDWHAGGISAAVYDQMNEMEREQFATKDQIWPRPDFKELVDNGMPLELAFRIKCLRDSIPSHIPLKGTSWRWPSHVDPEARRRGFVEALNTLKTSAMACKDVRGFVVNTHTEFQSLPEEGRMALRMRLPHQRKSMSPEYFFAPDTSHNYSYFSRKFQAAIADGFPNPKTVTTKKEKIQYPERELAQNPTREGLYDYRKGVNATPEMFMETFNLRGGEFGNWVDQDERQRSLNMAFDAFCDIADVLEIPKRQIGLNGTLALAFGARGTGGRGAAAAHYECARRVINLTKPHGAGALCHEWFHALDHHIGAGKEDVRGFASNGKSLVPEYEGHAKSFKESLAMLSKRDQTHEEARFEHEENSMACKTKVIEWITKLFHVSHKPLTPDAPHTEKWLTIQDSILSGNIGAARAMVDVYKSTVDARYLRFNPPQNTLRFIDSKERDYQRLSNVIEGDVYPPKIVDTNFVAKSRYWDNLRKKDYYTLPHELTARAFEAHIEQSLEDRGARDEYLVYGTKSSVYPIGSDREGRLSAFGYTVTQAARSVLGHEDPETNRDLPAIAKALEAPKTHHVNPEPTLEKPIHHDPTPLSQGRLF